MVRKRKTAASPPRTIRYEDIKLSDSSSDEEEPPKKTTTTTSSKNNSSSTNNNNNIPASSSASKNKAKPATTPKRGGGVGGGPSTSKKKDSSEDQVADLDDDKDEVSKKTTSKALAAHEANDDDDEEEDEDGDEDYHEDEESEPSDGEDENEDQEAHKHINYKNYQNGWLEKVSKICPCCKKTFSTCRDASLCLTGNHRRLRCYLCYNYYRNTETLFRHYEECHRGPKCKNKDGVLICPFCSKSIPFKATSCHVITLHIAPREAAQNGQPPPTNAGDDGGSDEWDQDSDDED